jgi:hypothetical protein
VLKGEGRLALTAFKANGEPEHPKEFCRKFTRQAGVLVRSAFNSGISRRTRRVVLVMSTRR